MSSRTVVHTGDTHYVTWTINADLTGATVTGRRRADGTEDPWDEFAVEVGEIDVVRAESVVKHKLTGTLPVGRYRVFIEAMNLNGLATIPTESPTGHLLVVLPAP